MPRVVSLIASATEIVCALGFEDQLVGRSHECDFPPAVTRLPVCTEPKFAVHGSSREIDQLVKDTLQEGTSVYRVDSDLLRRLRPEVIVTQAQCEVCAVSERDVQQAVCDWGEARPRIVTLLPNDLADVWADVRRVAEALSVPGRGAELVERLQGRMQSVTERARAQDRRPTVACLEWLDPLMAAGNWVPELVEMAGGVNLFGLAGKHAPGMTWEELSQRDPEVIVAMPCGLDLARTRAETPALTGCEDWASLRAVRAGRVYVTDGNQFFNRPGPRLVESLEILAEILHPGAFDFGHRGTGWDAL
ncbi:MAG: cobalamin-binding protein [Gemmataceae bacterium]|nr:cobalamin-binding protein [Gemmataceae bacterium]